ncbi:glutamine-hydrolyzing carbamoyl-phosphate synthase small subunit [Paenibacillus sp. GCM10027626]|uniref:glutamine-hydrolyzing carbamoyl-phosphate synthase small subunit n=1 Tax=Paenibacillus sp. GCM10027626 TaxID=3273411 RepID=UPI0036355922
MQARLLLEDGTLFTGLAFGAEGQTGGEVVFTTGMFGYQELLTDPSFCGQLVTMTYPLIGNYGISRDDFESIRPAISGLVVRHHEPVPSNWRAQYSLDQWLKEYNIPAISEIDTRMLTRILREKGTMKGIITTGTERTEELQERLGAIPQLQDQVAHTSTKSIYTSPGYGERIVLVDLGAKSGILRDLTQRGCDVIVVPYDTTAEQIRKFNPDGVLLSNGPGNPQSIPQTIETVRELLGEYPIFGICLGHQVFALACGATASKMNFGHHGSYPVKNVSSNRCHMAFKNHNYTINEDSVDAANLEITYKNNNDRSVEGLKHKTYPAFSVQFHPEASPGPYDSKYLFDEFLEMIRTHKQSNPRKPRQIELAESLRGELQYAQK